MSVIFSQSGVLVVVCVGVTVLGLAGLGALGARLGGADTARATARVVGWGVLAMGVTAGIGSLVGGVGS